MPVMMLGREVSEEALREGNAERGDYCIKEVRGKKRIIIYLGIYNPYGSQAGFEAWSVQAYNHSTNLHHGKPTKDALARGVFISDDKYKWAFYT